MNGIITQSAGDQLFNLLWAVVSGMIMGIYYDLYRILRAVFKPGRTVVILQDVLFWLTSAVAVFFVNITIYNGYVRIMFVVAVLLTWVIYLFTVGKATMFIVNWLIKMLKKLFAMLWMHLIRPVLGLFTRVFMLISQKITGILTLITKKQKSFKKS